MQQKGFFAHTLPKVHRPAFALQNEQNHGLQLFCPDSPYPQLLQKLAMPPAAAAFPALFCPFSPEADLLRKTSGFNYTMGSESEESSSIYRAAMYGEEDASFLSMTNAF
ncbi:hypothetical protein [Mucilaginibacter rubeus]|uniref:Uncharacterized protein n=1 Tax=Mucilaginibacter rubeus TaxID=2027860 RepID=A0A5C1I370_9SPHI|nr:hypothetical protein [Mucilaginibacter rubeus]QEM11858.1 hypothetical protein DEO27_018080 [Mucilaginibacter rubeus]